MGAMLDILHIWFKLQSRGEASLIPQDRLSHKNALWTPCTVLLLKYVLHLKMLARNANFSYSSVNSVKVEPRPPMLAAVNMISTQSPAHSKLSLNN